MHDRTREDLIKQAHKLRDTAKTVRAIHVALGLPRALAEILTLIEKAEGLLLGYATD